MRTMFDAGIVGRTGPFLGLNLPKFLQDAGPIYQATRNLIKNQGSSTTTPTAQPSVVPLPPAPVDNSMTYLVLGALGLGGAAAAWYFFRKKPGAKKK